VSPDVHHDGEERFRGRLDLATWRRLWTYVRRSPRDLAGLATAAVAVACADLGFPLVTRSVVNAVEAHGTDARLGGHVAVYALLTAVLGGGVWAFLRFGGNLRADLGHAIRGDAFENLQRLSLSYYDRRPVGWLVSRLTSDCERLTNVLAWGALDLFWGTTLMLGTATVMLVLDWQLALCVLAVVPVLAALSFVLQGRILTSAREVRRSNSRITGAYAESVQAVRTTKALAREEASLGEFRELTGEMYSWSMRNAHVAALVLPMATTVASLATAAVLVLGGVEFDAGGRDLGTLVAFFFFSFHFFEPVQELAQRFAEVQMAQAAAERVVGLVEEEPEIADSPAVRAAVDRARADGTASHDGGPLEAGRIAFDGVGFTYPEGQEVMRDFDLEVAPGETIALVGSTGGGKTTIVSLLCRFYEPTRGSVRLGGADTRERSLEWLRSRLAVVLQTPHLFRGSIADNVRYGRPGATDAEVEEAARTAGVLELAERLEGGLAFDVGEGGQRLSTGERQLVSIARALLAAPEILVLDEATSAVDAETERRVQAGLERALETSTSFVIAHRLSTVRNADRILVVEGGEVVEQGDHRTLLARDGRYRELLTRHGLGELPSADRAWSGENASAPPAG
jgi:ATP-binding cassette subfamily B protein